MRSTAGNYQNSLGVREFSQKANHKTYMIFFPRDIRNIRISYVCVFFIDKSTRINLLLWTYSLKV